MRHMAAADSDIDVFIDVAFGTRFGLRRYVGAFRLLEDAFEHQAQNRLLDAGGTLALHPRRCGMGRAANLLMAASKSPRLRLLHMRDARSVEISNITHARSALLDGRSATRQRFRQPDRTIAAAGSHNRNGQCGRSS